MQLFDTCFLLPLHACLERYPHDLVLQSRKVIETVSNKQMGSERADYESLCTSQTKLVYKLMES